MKKYVRSICVVVLILLAGAQLKAESIKKIAETKINIDTKRIYFTLPRHEIYLQKSFFHNTRNFVTLY